MIDRKEKQRLLFTICTDLSIHPEPLELDEKSYRRVSRVELLKSIHKRFPSTIQISDLYFGLFTLMDLKKVYYNSLDDLQTAMFGCNNSKNEL